MKIPKIFGNRIILVVVALALILIVLVSLINVGRMAFTGFSSQNKEKNKNTQPNLETPTGNSDLENTNNPSLSITVTDVNTNQDSSTTSSSDTSSATSSASGGNKHHSSAHNPGGGNGGGNNGGGGGGTTENPGSGNSNSNGNSNPQVNLKKKLTKKPKNLNLKMNGVETTDGEEFQGTVRLNLYKSNRRISDFDINFSEDADLSDIIADTDFTSGKAFMHSRSKRLKNIDLYIPKIDGIDSIVICSGASSFNQIYYGCSNEQSVTKEELLPLSSPRVEISSDGLYYIIHGITGTGAMGVNVTNISSSTQNATPPGNLSAFAGNVTEISMPGSSGITQAWAGYYGNVSGTIQLADGSDNVLYNWSLASPEGEVFASTNNSIVWNHLQCFNYTASATYADEAGNGGATNLYGTNLTQLETQYGVGFDDIDGVDETFYLLGSGTHNTFYVNYNQFVEGECQSTRIFDSSGNGIDNHFEEVLLYEPTTESVIFGSLLNEDLFGFDNRQHDFEMLVLENGHGTDTNPTLYYFYAAIS
jgi:hypothetical protein